MRAVSAKDVRHSNDWIGDVPDGWQKRPIFALFSERGETNDGYKTENVLSVLKDVGVINYEDKGDIGNKKSEDIERYKIVHAGDLVINSMNVIIGSVGVSSEYGALSPVYIVLRPRAAGVDMRYYGYVFASRDFQRWLTRIGYGILPHRMRIPLDNLKREYVPYPRLEKQEEIADFLDRETAKADALVAKYERLIELLEEKRIALVTQAVTKGLDQTTRMKDSGVEWIGDIPTHWQMWRLSRAFSLIGSGTTPPSSEPRWYGGDTAFVTTAELRENIVSETERTVSDEALRTFSALKVYPAGAIGVAMYGATIGRCAILGVPAAANQACCILDNSAVLTNEYALYWFMAKRNEIIALAVGGGQPNISQDIIRALRIPAPPLEEQYAICEYLRSECERIELLVSAARKAIELSKEHRSALFTAAVTGQIDVRTYKAKEPMEAIA